MKKTVREACRENNDRVHGRIRGLLVGLALCAAAVQPARAGVSLLQTRVIYPQSAQAVGVTLHNGGDEVYLVQSAVTDWETDRPSSQFTVQPPLFRVEGRSNGTMRVVRTGGELPQDRESVFHFRVNAIPGGTAPAKGGASLSIALGMGIKLFFRPEGLALSPAQAWGELTFHRQKEGVVVKNPTPYYLTFARLTLGGEAVSLDRQPPMIAPFSQVVYPTSGRGGQAEWALITDYGGNSDAQTARIQPD